MLVLLLAYYASMASAGPARVRESHLYRRQTEDDMNTLMQSADMNMMQPPFYRAGKIPVRWDYTSDDIHMSKMGWIASVNVTGIMYDLMVDNMLSDTWLYGPADPRKCEVEERWSKINRCYLENNGTMDIMDMTHYKNNAKPFYVLNTGPGKAGISGTRYIFNNVTAPTDGATGAYWPAVVALADNIYDMRGGGPSPRSRTYHGSLGLAKMDMGQATFGSGDSIMKYPQTPFHDASKWTYFTTYFNDDDYKNMYIGFQYMDAAAYMAGNTTTLTTSPDSKKWELDADPTWMVKVWEEMAIGDDMTKKMTKINLPFPDKGMDKKANIKLDLAAGTTYLDFATVEAIYEAFDGSCTRTPGTAKARGKMMDSGSEMYPYCTLPVTVHWDKEAGVSMSPKKLAKFSLPWGPKADIMIEPITMLDRLESEPCVGPDSKHFRTNNKTDCEMNAYGLIQPSTSWDKAMNMVDQPWWIYGDVVYQNAFFQWDTMNNGTVMMAPYSTRMIMEGDTGGAKPGTPIPKSKKVKSKKPRSKKVRKHKGVEISPIRDERFIGY
ncbi:hypothetical protein ABW20_dc0100938 [Dactylellina cionopaga]|nr:hypothetical protein ABW20_dc0100938 [Dactylellina cionopaga]